MSAEEDVTTHLTDEDVAGLLAGEAEADATAHAEACTDCAREVDALRRAMGGWRQALDREARARPPAARPVGGRRLAWPLLAAASVVAALLAGPGRVRRVEAPATPSPATVAESDQALLDSVERALSREVPEALEPAALIVDDLAATSPR